MDSLATTAIAAGTAFATTIASLFASNRIERRRRADDAKRVDENKAEALEHVLSLYRDPLLRAALDLQSRIYNIEARDFLRYYRSGTDSEKTYAVAHTLYVFAEYFGWSEILRRETQFLNLGDIARTRTVRKALDDISVAFLSDEIGGPPFRVFRGQQRAIGELMMVQPERNSEPGRRHETIGFATFVGRRADDPAFARWFSELEADVVNRASDDAERVPRLLRIQHALVELFGTLDPDHVRADQANLMRLPAPPA